jgi:hypothetical protein
MCGILSARPLAVGPEEAIPEREAEAEVVVEIVLVDGVMDEVHRGRHEEAAQDAVGPGRETEIGVGEKRRGVEEDLEDEHPEGGNAEKRDRGELDEGREDELARMETDPARDVELRIRVMHPVEAPEPAPTVEETVLAVDREVEPRDAERHRPGDTESEKREKPPVPARGPENEAKRHEKTGRHGRQHRERDVRRARASPVRARRHETLEEKPEREDAEKEDETKEKDAPVDHARTGG